MLRFATLTVLAAFFVQHLLRIRDERDLAWAAALGAEVRAIRAELALEDARRPPHEQVYAWAVGVGEVALGGRE